MKTKLLALGFSMAFLMGNAVYGELETDPKGPVYTLEPFVVTPHVVRLLNDQKLDPVNFEEIILRDVEEISEQVYQNQIPTQIASKLKAIKDVPLVAAAD